MPLAQVHNEQLPSRELVPAGKSRELDLLFAVGPHAVVLFTLAQPPTAGLFARVLKAMATIKIVAAVITTRPMAKAVGIVTTQQVTTL